MPPDQTDERAGTLTFRVGGTHFALPLEEVREVLPRAALSRPPAMARNMEGFLNLGGDLLPVLKLDRLMGLPEEEIRREDHFIVVTAEEKTVVLPVTAVDDVLTKARAPEVLPVTGSLSFNECVRGSVRCGGVEYHLLAPAKILLEEEFKRLEEFRAAEQQRLSELRES